MESLKTATIPVGKGTTEIGLPFSKAYYKPTPKLFRQIGDWLLFAGSVTSAIASVTGNPILAAVSAICAAGAKILSNCFKDDVAAAKQVDEIKKDNIEVLEKEKREVDAKLKAVK